MKQYIDKAAVVAEIERRKHKLLDNIICERDKEWVVRTAHQLNRIILFLDTLDVKEVEEEPKSIWHDADKQPTMYRKYLVRYSDGRVSGSWERHDDGFIPWKDVVKEHGFTHWCYVEDLLKL